MKNIKLYILFLSVLGLNTTKAQDWHLSMYDAAPMFLNPAMTGVVEGEWRVHAQYRNQWGCNFFGTNQRTSSVSGWSDARKRGISEPLFAAQCRC